MSQEKEVLEGIVNLGLTVKTADGVLAAGANVKMSDDNEVEAVDANYDASVGYVLRPNKEASGKCTLVTRGKRVADVTTGAAYSYGALLMFDSAGKAVKAKAVRASGTVTITDYTAVDAGETVTVNGVALTAGGTDWTAATSNAATALSLAAAINNKVAGVKASAAAGVVTVAALDAGQVGNDVALATSMEAAEGEVSGSTLSGGKDFFPFGMALEESTAADQTKSVLWF